MRAHEVMEEIADEYGVSIAELRGRGDGKELFRPRQMAMRVLRNVLQLHIVVIGRLFDGRNPTTVYHYISDKRRERDLANGRAAWRAKYQKIKEKRECQMPGSAASSGPE